MQMPTTALVALIFLVGACDDGTEDETADGAVSGDASGLDGGAATTCGAPIA